MYFGTKSYLKSNRNHTHTVSSSSIALFSQRPLDRSQNTIDFSDHSHNIELPIFS
jgi:hypothetical protein